MARNKLITVRYNEDEFKIIKRKVAATGKSYSDTIRELSLRSEKASEERIQIATTLIAELGKNSDSILQEITDIKQTLNALLDNVRDR